MPDDASDFWYHLAIFLAFTLGFAVLTGCAGVAIFNL